jgi:hypothetical protein
MIDDSNPFHRLAQPIEMTNISLDDIEIESVEGSSIVVYQSPDRAT